MLKFIVDENLPYYFNLWHHEEFIHVYDIPEVSSDNEIREYAKIRNLTIIRKDADFSNKMMFTFPPPKVIHLKIGNLKIKELHNFLNKIWHSVYEENLSHKLVNVYFDRIESFE